MDTQGDIATRHYHLVSADFVTAVTDAAVVTAAVEGMTEGLIVGHSIGEHFEENAVSYPIGADNTINVSMTFLLSGVGNKKANMRLPSPKNGIFVSANGPGNNILDTGNVDVIAWQTAVTTKLEISDGETAQALESGRRV